ncbi:MAG: tetratricopeptide repeat protein, partial [Cyanobacteria bacterium K_DeepCast_150m_m2_101]|nr:tetratricopeptide repeat protein [Cyanobacteria bacterium K_DeepCast_150m_m2_101]
ACRWHQQGNVAEAERLYRQALAANGNLENGWRNLGVLLRKQGKLEESCACTEQALRLNPQDPSLLGNYGNILRDLKRLPLSQQVLERALQLDPQNAGLRQSLAITCNHGRQFEQARQLLEPFIARGEGVDSNHWLELGNAFHGLGEHQKAVHCWQKGAELGSGQSKLFQQLNIAQSLCEQGQFAAARQLLQPLLADYDNQANLHYALGVISRGEGQLQGADRHFQRALELEPNYPLCLNTYGLMLRDLGRINAARHCFSEALKYQGDFGEAMNNLGSVLKDVGQLQEGLHWLRRSAELLPQNPVIQSNVLFTLCGYNLETPELRLAEARRYGERFATAPFERWKDRIPDPSPHRRLRLGLISPDFCRHAVSYFIEPLLERWDRGQLEVVAYHCGEHHDDYTERLKPKVDHWRSVKGAAAEDLIQQILRDEIDILLDLAGHTAGNRLDVLAHKPAPIQASYLGYYATTGLEQVDYWVTDAVLHPESTADLACEEQWRLDRCYVCFRPIPQAPAVAEPPLLRNGFATFGSFNQSRKITQHTAEHWMAVLRAFPSSRLLLKSKNLGEPEERQRVQQLFASLGLEEERLILQGHCLHLEEHMASYHS